MAVGIINSEGAKASAMQRWFREEGDIRKDLAVSNEILQFIRAHGAQSTVVTDGIIGCPHEEGIDYPEGEVCPQCPFWAHRNRWTGEMEE